MNRNELRNYIEDNFDETILGQNRIMIRNCVDGKMYDIEEIGLAIYGNESIIIIDIKPEKL